MTQGALMRRFVHVLFAPVVLSTILAQPSAIEPAKSSTASLHDLSLSLEKLTDRVRPAVVQVFTTAYAPISDDSEGTTTTLLGRQRGVGSGVIVTADGYIITNSHVVENGRNIRVKLAATAEEMKGKTSLLKPQGKTVPAKVVGVDRESDLAVLKIDAGSLSHLALGDSDLLRQGPLVLAFGNPLGLESSVSMGVVSSVARQIRTDDPMVYVQTDAPINPGNSGGPLVDVDGRVMGINTFILSQSGGSEGIGFAVPANIVKNVFNQIRKDGHVHRGQIGVYAQTITPEIARGLNLPQDRGVIVSDVYPDGPADKAGLKVEDIVIALNGKPMENARQLNVNLYNQLVKQKVTLEVLRDGKRMTVTVPVIERDDDPLRFMDFVDPAKNLVPKLGILAIPITPEIAEMVEDLRFEHGLIVAARSSEAAFNGLKTGDVIYFVNRVPITSVKALEEQLESIKAGDPAILQVQRGDKMMFLSVDLE
jgi:serine protease Do